MATSGYYWHDLATGDVIRADERQEGWMGPFGTSEEAAIARETLIAHIESWMASDDYLRNEKALNERLQERLANDE